MFANLVVFVVGGAVFGCVEELGGVENVLDWSGGHHSGDHSGKHAVGLRFAFACRCHPLHLSWSLCWIPIKKLTKSPDTLPIIQRCSLSISISIFKS